MNRIGVVLLAVGLTILAHAVNAGGRSSGETISDPIFIPAIPYMDTGTTCEYLDDYEEACPYAGSTAPDVVYSYIPTSDVTVDIDLCGSSYDTKVFVYENTWTPGNPYACNDDFYFGEPCGIYVSKIEELSLSAGNTYYIVVDGYNVDCGDYSLEISDSSQPPPLTFELTFSVGDVTVGTATGEDEEVYTTLRIPDGSALAVFDSTSMLGEPMLPMVTVYVAMPPGVGADEVRVSTFTKEPVPIDHPIWPSQPPRTYCMTEPGDDWCSPDPAVYEVDADYPGQIVELAGMTDVAGQGLAVINVYPIEFNPVQQECSIYTSILLEIPEGEPYTPNDYLPPDCSPICENLLTETIGGQVINPDDIQFREDPEFVERPFPYGNWDHIIIAPRETEWSWWKLVAHRTMFGLSSKIFTVESIYNEYSAPDNAQKIRDFVRDAHEQCGTLYFLMAGTPADVPIGYKTFHRDIQSDQYYADFDDDWQDDVFVGRVPSIDPLEIETYIDKVIRYETLKTEHIRKTLLISMDPHQGLSHEELMETIDVETVQPQSWNSEKVYDSQGSNHKNAFISAIESGTHLVLHSGHGNTDVMDLGYKNHDEVFRSYEVDMLDPPPGNQTVFASTGCRCNTWWVPSIARRLVIDSGEKLAVAFAGNTDDGLYNTNPFLRSNGVVKRFAENAFELRRLGAAIAQARTGVTEQSLGNVKRVRWTFNLLGDPAIYLTNLPPSSHAPITTYPDLLTPWEEQPFPIHVENDSGEPIGGAYVCLWEPSVAHSPNIYLTGFTNASGDISFTLPASDVGMHITVSHADYPPYMAWVGIDVADVEPEFPSDPSLLPVRLELHPAAPSPFSAGTTVHFDLPAAGRVQLDVIDVTGRRLRSLFGGERLEAGRHSVVWDGRTSSGEHVGSGMYWLRLSTAEEKRSRRVIVIR